MAANYIRIEGVEESLKQLDQAPDKLQKIVMKAMSYAARKAVAAAKSGMARSEWADLLKYKVVKGSRMQTGDTTAIVGMFKSTKQDHSSEIPKWFKAYWTNYGTLTLRDPAHQFVNKVKKGTKSRRNNVGQPAENFFDSAMSSFDSIMPQEFEKSLQKQQDKILSKNG